LGLASFKLGQPMTKKFRDGPNDRGLSMVSHHAKADPREAIRFWQGDAWKKNAFAFQRPLPPLRRVNGYYLKEYDRGLSHQCEARANGSATSRNFGGTLRFGRRDDRGGKTRHHDKAGDPLTMREGVASGPPISGSSLDPSTCPPKNLSGRICL